MIGIEGFEASPPGHKERNANRWGYKIGDWMASPYYVTYLAPDVIERTYEQSLDKYSDFRSHFRVPLVLIDRLTDLFISRELIKPSRCQQNPYTFRVTCQLLIMAALEHLGTSISS